MPSSSERNTALENSLVESYRIAWNRLSFDGFEREAGILTITYSELLDTSVDTLFRFARDGRWLCETQIASITRQSLSSQNIRAAALCLANTATWLKSGSDGGGEKNLPAC
jgi:hypothetical protein